jgi:outer membrane protein assembly factor BamB
VDGNVYAFDAGTGANHWAVSAGAAISASPIIANGVVYVGTGSGDFLALSAAKGTVLQSAHGNGAILANAAVSDGILYFSDIGTGGFDDVGNTYAYALLAGTDGVSQRAVGPPAPASLVPDMNLTARRQ